MSEEIESWRGLLLDEHAAIHKAIHLLEETSTKIVLVVNHKNYLVGTISDGDIRRGLLRGVELSDSVLEVAEKNALVVPPGISSELVMQMMIANKIQHIPIVDSSNEILGLHVWEKLTQPQVLPNTMVIMAGGRGTRLHPYTENCPKPMLHVAGKPILQHILEKAKLEGFRSFAISVLYLSEQIEDYFKDGKQLGVNIVYLKEKTPLGTAGSLSLLNPVPNAPLIVTNGDVLADLKYSELLHFHQKHKAMATMAVRAHESQSLFGEVKTDGLEIIEYVEKPLHRSNINAGVYALNPETMNHIPEGELFDMPQLFERLRINGNRTIAYPIHEKWMDVGRPEELLRANEAPHSRGQGEN